MNAVRVGAVVDGKYRIDAVLGQGGMGMVVSAWHLHLDERVAIKFLLPQALGNAEVVARFQREARAAAKIKGEHVCRVLDVGVTGEGQPFMVMEHLEGEDLGKLSQSCGPLPVEEAIHYILQVCEALAEAHGKGIVHRDLKPSNLFLTRRPNGSPLVKLLDFGISKLAGSELGGELTLTTTNAVVGSFAYMSPEQARNARDVDQRSDIWSLGVVLHKLLTSVSPFEASTASEFIAKIVADPPAPLRVQRPDVPVALEQVVRCCLEKDRERRYPSVVDLALALAPFAPRDAELVRSSQSIARRHREVDRSGSGAGASALAPRGGGATPFAVSSGATPSVPFVGSTPPMASLGSAPPIPPAAATPPISSFSPTPPEPSASAPPAFASAEAAPPPGSADASGLGAGAAATASQSTTPAPWTPPLDAPRRGAGRLMAAAAVGVVLLVGGAMVMLLQSGPGPAPRGTEVPSAAAAAAEGAGAAGTEADQRGPATGAEADQGGLAPSASPDRDLGAAGASADHGKGRPGAAASATMSAAKPSPPAGAAASATMSAAKPSPPASAAASATMSAAKPSPPPASRPSSSRPVDPFDHQ